MLGAVSSPGGSFALQACISFRVALILMFLTHQASQKQYFGRKCRGNAVLCSNRAVVKRVSYENTKLTEVLMHPATLAGSLLSVNRS